MDTKCRYATLKKKATSDTSSDALHNSLDWDSPSTKTGTVKRRPNSEDENGPTFSLFSTLPKSDLTTSTTSSCSTVSTTSSTYDNYARVYFHDKKKNYTSDKINKDFAKVQFTSGIPSGSKSYPRKYYQKCEKSDCDDTNVNCEIKMKTFSFSTTSPYNSSSVNYNGYQRIISPGKISDTDSGIASPLSPSSLNSFLGYSYEEKNHRQDIEDLLTDEKVCLVAYIKLLCFVLLCCVLCSIGF